MKIVLSIVVVALACGALGFVWRPVRSNATVAAAAADAAPQVSFARCVPPVAKMGMTKDELITLCGPADAISHQLLESGRVDREQWSYRKDGIYAYLTNGRLDALQYAENGEQFRWDERR